MGIITHFLDMNNPLVAYLQNLSGGISVIKMQGYNDWHEVIDEIKQCDFIISSSLHGLILADAYQVPNVWIEFSDKVYRKVFKFRDYFSAVNRDTKDPVLITDKSTLDDLQQISLQWKNISIDLKPLIDSCPFNIKTNE